MAELGTIDAGGEGKSVLLAVINDIYGKDYTLDDFDFGVPEFVVTPNPTHNSLVKLGPKAHTGYYGFKTVYYNRIHVSELGTIKVPFNGEQYLTQLLPKINVKYGILIKPEDVFEKTITPPLPNQEVTLDLNFRPDSLVFYGGNVIVLGNNDPSIEFDTPIVLPFANETVFFVNDTYPVPEGVFNESSSVALSSDYIRQRSSRVQNPDDSIFLRGAKARYSALQYAKLKDFLPFVYTWNVLDTKNIRGLNIYGDILELDSGGENWTFITNILGLTNATPLSEIEALKDRPVFKNGAQTANGDLFIIRRNDTLNRVDVMKSVNAGDTWTTVPTTAGNEHFTRYGGWDTTKILDVAASGTNLHFLVVSEDPYTGSPTTDIQSPAVETYSTVTGLTTFFPFGDRDLKDLEHGLDFTHSVLKFVNNGTSDGTAPNVVALAATAVSKTPVAVYYQKGVANYDGIVVPNTDLEYDSLINGYYDIAAYKRKLLKSVNYLLSIEIIGRIDSSIIDFELYLNSKERTENGFFNHGVQAHIAVVGADGISKWSHSTNALGYGTTPKFLTMVGKGIRTGFIYQGEVGLFKTNYTEDTQGNFTPTFEHLFKSGAQTGYNIHSTYVAGQHSPMKILEYSTGVNTLVPTTNGELSKNIITYSFTTKTDSGEYGWYVANAVNTTLVKRVFDPIYSHIGINPLAVASMEGDLFVWSENGRTIYKSTTGGKSWLPYAATQAYYIDTKDIYEGSSVLQLKPDYFKLASLKNEKLLFEVKYENSFKGINTAMNELNETIVAKDNVLYEIDASDTFDQPIQFNSVYSARGLNVLSEYSPRRILAWDTDTDNNVLAISEHSTNRTTPYTVPVNLNQIHASITADPTHKLFTANFDTAYLGLKHVAVTKTSAGASKLHVVNEIEVPFRYYKINILNNYSNTARVSIQEIELAATVGGADITTPATVVTASSISGVGYEAANVVDDELTLIENGAWQSDPAQTYPQWLKLDLVTPTVVREIKILGRTDTDVNEAPKNFELLGSNDDTNWTLVRSFTVAEDYAQNTSKTFSNPSTPTVDVFNFSDNTSPLFNFSPRVFNQLWEYTDSTDTYTPLVLIGLKEVALFERVDTEGRYKITRHSLTIPGNNNSDLLIIPMFNDNRRDVLLYQKGNGVFRFNYLWDMFGRVSTITLVRVFNLTGMNDINILNGCWVDSTPVEPYGEVTVPVIPPNGTVLDTYCVGLNRVERRADGRLGSYEVVIEVNSVACGYEPPVPGPVEDGGAGAGT